MLRLHKEYKYFKLQHCIIEEFHMVSRYLYPDYRIKGHPVNVIKGIRSKRLLKHKPKPYDADFGGCITYICDYGTTYRALWFGFWKRFGIPLEIWNHIHSYITPALVCNTGLKVYKQKENYNMVEDWNEYFFYPIYIEIRGYFPICYYSIHNVIRSMANVLGPLPRYILNGYLPLKIPTITNIPPATLLYLRKRDKWFAHDVFKSKYVRCYGRYRKCDDWDCWHNSKLLTSEHLMSKRKRQTNAMELIMGPKNTVKKPRVPEYSEYLNVAYDSQAEYTPQTFPRPEGAPATHVLSVTSSNAKGNRGRYYWRDSAITGQGQNSFVAWCDSATEYFTAHPERGYTLRAPSQTEQFTSNQIAAMSIKDIKENCSSICMRDLTVEQYTALVLQIQALVAEMAASGELSSLLHKD